MRGLRQVGKRVDAIRRDGGPRFVEFLTYRFRAHSMFDPELYRDKEEVEAWKKRGPIVTFIGRLRETGCLTDADLAGLEAEVEREVAAAVEFAENGTWEPVENLTLDVYTERGA